MIPEALYAVGIRKNEGIIREATKLQIAVIAIIDNNDDPFGIQYPIPASAVVENNKLYEKLVLNAIAETKKKEMKSLCAA